MMQEVWWWIRVVWWTSVQPHLYGVVYLMFMHPRCACTPSVYALVHHVLMCSTPCIKCACTPCINVSVYLLTESVRMEVKLAAADAQALAQQLVNATSGRVQPCSVDGE